jgi:hypothetical protein
MCAVRGDGDDRGVADGCFVGEQVTLKPPTALVEFYVKHALDQGLIDIEKAILDIRQVGFSDRSVWTRGRLSRMESGTR